MFCQHCGAQVAENVQFCPKCGHPQGPLPPPPPAFASRVYTPPGQVRVEIGKWIGEGWRVVTSDLLMMMVGALIVICVSSAVPVILQGAMTAGFYIYCSRRLLGRSVELGDIFKGFNYFVPSLVASLLISVFSFFGLLLCILPVFLVAAMFQFTYLFIIDKRMDFWPAMMASKDLVMKNWLDFTLFLIVLGLIQILGALALLVGLLITIPVMYAATAAAYKDLVGFEPDAQF